MKRIWQIDYGSLWKSNLCSALQDIWCKAIQYGQPQYSQIAGDQNEHYMTESRQPYCFDCQMASGEVYQVEPVKKDHMASSGVCTQCGMQAEALAAPVLSMPDRVTSGNAITISWASVPNAKEYYVEIYVDSFDSANCLDAYTTSSCSVSATAYRGEEALYVRVTARSSLTSSTATTGRSEIVCGHYNVSDVYQGTSYEQISENQKQHIRIDSYLPYCSDCENAVGEVRNNRTKETHSLSGEVCSACGMGIDKLAVPVLRLPDSIRVGNTYSISWQNVANADEYYVEVYVDGSCLYTKSTLATHTSVTVNSGKVLNIKVIARNSLMESAAAEASLSVKLAACSIDKHVEMVESGEVRVKEGNAQGYEYKDAENHTKKYWCSFVCPVCGENVSTIAQEEEEHDFSNGRCWDCNYKCSHEETSRSLEDTEYAQYNSSQHKKIKIYTVYCDICDAVVEANVRRASFEQHIFRNGRCKMCDMDIDYGPVEPAEQGFTMSPNPVKVGNKVSFTVYAEGASQVRMLVDGQHYSGDVYRVSNGKADFTRAFTQAGNRRVQFEFLVNGVWSAPCSAQTLVVEGADQLDKPVVNPVGDQYVGEGFTATWKGVPNAQEYVVYVTQGGRIVWPSGSANNKTSGYSMSIPGSALAYEGVYSLDVYATGANYAQNHGASTFIVKQRVTDPCANGHAWSAVTYAKQHPHAGTRTCQNCGFVEAAGNNTNRSCCKCVGHTEGSNGCCVRCGTVMNKCAAGHTWGNQKYASKHPHKGEKSCLVCGEKTTVNEVFFSNCCTCLNMEHTFTEPVILDHEMHYVSSVCTVCGEERRGIIEFCCACGMHVATQKPYEITHNHYAKIRCKICNEVVGNAPVIYDETCIMCNPNEFDWTSVEASEWKKNYRMYQDLLHDPQFRDQYMYAPYGGVWISDGLAYGVAPEVLGIYSSIPYYAEYVSPEQTLILATYITNKTDSMAMNTLKSFFIDTLIESLNVLSEMDNVAKTDKGKVFIDTVKSLAEEGVHDTKMYDILDDIRSMIMNEDLAETLNYDVSVLSPERLKELEGLMMTLPSRNQESDAAAFIGDIFGLKVGDLFNFYDFFCTLDYAASREVLERAVAEGKGVVITRELLVKNSGMGPAYNYTRYGYKEIHIWDSEYMNEQLLYGSFYPNP